jgi:hypothetical protein
MGMPDGPLTTVREAALKQRLIGLLRSPLVQKIDFFIGYMHISGAGYSRVADAVANGSIKLFVGGVPAGAAAAFYPGDRFFRFPDGTYGLTRSDEADMVHESTHAIRALTYTRQSMMLIPDTQNEAAAYVADALYTLYSGSSNSSPQPIFIKADQIAQSIKDRKGAMVSPQDEANLRAFVAFHPVYSNDGKTYTSLART